MNQPSETVRYLASYLQEHKDDFIWVTLDDPYIHCELGLDNQELAKLIQEFYDNLP